MEILEGSSLKISFLTVLIKKQNTDGALMPNLTLLLFILRLLSTEFIFLFVKLKKTTNRKQQQQTLWGGGKTVMKFEVKWMLLGFGLHCKSFSYPVTTSSLKRIVSYSFQLLKAFQLFLLCKIFSIM